MAIISLVFAVRKYLEKLISKRNRSFSEYAAITVLSILIAVIAKYPNRAIFTRPRPDLKDRTVPGWPILGNMPAALKKGGNTHYGMKERFDHYGGVFAISVPLRGWLIAINSPEHIEYIMKTNFNNYIKGYPIWASMKDFLPGGIFITDGDEWRFHRKTSVGVFNTKMYRRVTEEDFVLGAGTVCSIFDKYDQLGQPFDLHALFFKQTLDVFGKLTFGIEFNALNTEGPHEFGDAFDYLTSNLTSRSMNPFWEWTDYLVSGKVKKVRNAIATLDKYAYITIEKRRNEPEEEKEKRPKDLLDHFINHVDDDGTMLSDRQLRDVFVSYMFAGRDSTALALSWQFYSLLANPRILKNVLKELDIVLGGSEKYTYETMMNELPYLKAVFHETLRLYPPVPRNTKMAVNDDVLPDGTIVYKDDKIIYSTWSMGRTKSVWGVDAEDFVPERWLVEDEVSSPKHSTATASGRGVSPFGKFRMESMFKFNSFNCNPRLCLGQTFATLQAMVTTCMFLQNFDMSLVPGQPVPEAKVSVMLAMNRPLMVYAKRKHSRESHNHTTSLSTSYMQL
ncbi:hypothetical protein BGX26_009073 [Mortierella sp. AD094]|nr:hypothetical protein BGX26_009073 [Mortierella sp. AD094]